MWACEEASRGASPGDHRTQTPHLGRLAGDGEEPDEIWRVTGDIQTLLACVPGASEGMTSTKARRWARKLHAEGHFFSSQSWGRYY